MAKMQSFPLIIAEDHPMMRDGLRRAAKEAGANVMAEATTGEEAIALCEAHRPDILLLDLNMPHTDPKETLRRIPALFPALKIIIVTAHGDPKYVAMAQKAGVAGYVLKEEAAQQLVRAIEAVREGATYFSDAVKKVLIEEISAETTHILDTLTEQELHVLTCLSHQRTNRDIADLLSISTNTVKYHLKNVYAKLDVSSRKDAARWARNNGLI